MRREQRTKDEWGATWLAQQTSGLNAREYCEKHNIHFKTFSARKSDIRRNAVKPTGKLVNVLKPNSTPVSASPLLSVVYQGVTVNVSQAVEAKWLAEVMKALDS